MVRIRGFYEYDDDDLTPGKKKEGGLHQNLFDEEGNLRGSARFIPDNDQPEDVYGFGYVDPYYAAQIAAEAEERRERELQEAAEFITKAVVLATVAYVKAKPHAQRLWREKIDPTIQARRDRRARRKIERQARRKQKRPTAQSETTEISTRVENQIVDGTVIPPTNDLVIASEEYRRNMSSSEAQARYLMALAARAFSDEQLRMVANANIVKNEQFIELESALAKFPPAQVAQLIDQLELNPSVSADEKFDFAKFLTEAVKKIHLDELRE
jgi:hypothetical protein